MTFSASRKGSGPPARESAPGRASAAGGASRRVLAGGLPPFSLAQPALFVRCEAPDAPPVVWDVVRAWVPPPRASALPRADAPALGCRLWPARPPAALASRRRHGRAW